MLGFFVKAGDARVGSMFQPYVSGPSGFRTMLASLGTKNYGSSLRLILIQYYVEGEFEVFGPERLTVHRYSAKNRDISVAVPVTRATFHILSEGERREFIVRTTLDAVRAVKARPAKKGFDFDFDALLRDVEQAAVAFVSL